MRTKHNPILNELKAFLEGPEKGTRVTLYLGPHELGGNVLSVNLVDWTFEFDSDREDDWCVLDDEELLDFSVINGMLKREHAN